MSSGSERIGTGIPTFADVSDEAYRGDYNRLFVQLSANAGCPINCGYCYIPRRGQAAEPLDLKQLENWLDTATESSEFSEKTLVSLGCDTDPNLENIVPATKLVLDYFGQHRYVQLATKLPLSDPVLEVIGRRTEAGAPPVMVSTSITSIQDAKWLEPLAPSPQERAKNLAYTRQEHGIASAAIIKPYHAGSIEEVDVFADVLASPALEAVVVGGMIAADRTGNMRPFALDSGRSHLELRPQGAAFRALLEKALRNRNCTPAFFGSAATALIELIDTA